jgi:hypothetical protein
VREMQERGSRIEDAAKVFDEMLTAGEVKLSLRSESRSRMHAAQTCADAVRQGRGNAGPADEEEEEQQHEGLTTSSAQHGAAEATGCGYEFDEASRREELWSEDESPKGFGLARPRM